METTETLYRTTSNQLMTTLYILDTTAELIESAYSLGTLVRKHLVPALVAIYVAGLMAYEYLSGLKGPTRSQMIRELTREWKNICRLDPTSDDTDVPEFIDWLHSLSDDELRLEHKGL